MPRTWGTMAGPPLPEPGSSLATGSPSFPSPLSSSSSPQSQLSARRPSPRSPTSRQLERAEEIRRLNESLAREAVQQNQSSSIPRWARIGTAAFVTIVSFVCIVVMLSKLAKNDDITDDAEAEPKPKPPTRVKSKPTYGEDSTPPNDDGIPVRLGNLLRENERGGEQAQAIITGVGAIHRTMEHVAHTSAAIRRTIGPPH